MADANRSALETYVRTKKSSQKKKKLLIVVAVLVVLLIIAVVVIFVTGIVSFGSNPTKDKVNTDGKTGKGCYSTWEGKTCIRHDNAKCEAHSSTNDLTCSSYDDCAAKAGELCKNKESGDCRGFNISPKTSNNDHEVYLCRDETLTATNGCDPSSWAGLDGTTVCGPCAALVNVRENGGTCNAYCAAQGLSCADGWDDTTDETCSLDAAKLGCEVAFTLTSDGICQCSPSGLCNKDEIFCTATDENNPLTCGLNLNEKCNDPACVNVGKCEVDKGYKVVAVTNSDGVWTSNVYYDGFRAASGTSLGCLVLPETDQLSGFSDAEKTTAFSAAECNEQCYDAPFCLAYVYDNAKQDCYLSPTLPKWTDAQKGALLGTPCDTRSYRKCSGDASERVIRTARVCKAALAKLVIGGSGQTENGQKCMLKEGTTETEICSVSCPTERKYKEAVTNLAEQAIARLAIDQTNVDECRLKCNANPRCRSHLLANGICTLYERELADSELQDSNDLLKPVYNRRCLTP